MFSLISLVYTYKAEDDVIKRLQSRGVDSEHFHVISFVLHSHLIEGLLSFLGPAGLVAEILVIFQKYIIQTTQVRIYDLQFLSWNAMNALRCGCESLS